MKIMAVSGRKASDFRGSVTVTNGSFQDFEHSCEPCLAFGQHIEAHGFCLDCREYLCKNCFAYHQRMKATKHHHILGIHSIEEHNIYKNDSAFCNEKCLNHQNEIIKFFCTNHEFLGCTDCITLNHRTCKIDYIPDKCAGIGASDEYRNTMRELDQKLKDMDVVINKATTQDKKIDSSHVHVIKEIIKFRKEINDHLDQLQKQVETDAVKKKIKDKQTVKKVLETCTNISLDIKKLKSILQDSKSLLQNGQLYIMIKHAKSKLKLDDLKNAQESLELTNVQCKFDRNGELGKLITRQDMFGKLSLSATLVTPRRKKVFDNLTHGGDINVRTKSDRTECIITGCAILSSNKLVLADYNNYKLKVVATQTKSVIEEKTLDSRPFDIAVLPKNQIGVTMLDQKEILVMSTAGKLFVIRTIPVKGDCRGIKYHQDHLYVVCSDSKCLFILDIHGNINNKISLKNEITHSPNYILLSEDAKHIYISNSDNQSVVSVTLQGDVSAAYKHKDLNGPLGMLMVEDGSLLVCCYYNNNIHHISGDLKQGHKTTVAAVYMLQSSSARGLYWWTL